MKWIKFLFLLCFLVLISACSSNIRISATNTPNQPLHRPNSPHSFGSLNNGGIVRFWCVERLVILSGIQETTNMNLIMLERTIGWIGLVGVIFVLSVIFYGLWRGTKRPLHQTNGLAPKLLRSPIFYIFTSALYFGLCYLIWLPFPIILSPVVQTIALILGSLLFFSGLGLILWGRLTLGKLYNASTSLGAPLFMDHQLITTGPFAFVRHPMYLGILLTGMGGIFLYRTWTMVFLAANFFGLLIRTKREEEALAKEFGDQWQAYSIRVPAFLPGLKKDRKNEKN